MPYSTRSRSPSSCPLSPARRRLLVGSLAVLSSDQGVAQVYKCTQRDGKVAYQAAPCPDLKAATLDIRARPLVEAEYPPSPPLRGDSEPEFLPSIPDPAQRRAREALALLKAKAPAAYVMVLGYIGVIEPSSARNHMRAWVTPPTMGLAADTPSRTVTLVAGSFAHEAYHSKLYHDYLGAHPGAAVPYQAWGGTQSEIRCERFALDVMRQIGAPTREIDWAKAHGDGSHVNDWDYQGDTPSAPR